MEKKQEPRNVKHLSLRDFEIEKPFGKRTSIKICCCDIKVIKKSQLLNSGVEHQHRREIKYNPILDKKTC
jgi:hypothetical protein